MAHTLNYLYQKYKIVASANCKDQYGTDGYTLWGVYWNQAYYPSKINSLKAMKDGKEISVEGTSLVVTDAVKGKLHIRWPLKSFKGSIEIDMDEKELQIKMKGDRSIKWFLDLTTAGNSKLPFVDVREHQVDCMFEGMKYSVGSKRGTFSKPDDSVVFWIVPEGNVVRLSLNQ